MSVRFIAILLATAGAPAAAQTAAADRPTFSPHDCVSLTETGELERFRVPGDQNLKDLLSDPGIRCGDSAQKLWEEYARSSASRAQGLQPAITPLRPVGRREPSEM